jgi:hypothetical protein
LACVPHKERCARGGTVGLELESVSVTGVGTGMTCRSRLSAATGVGEGAVGWWRLLGQLGRVVVLGCSRERGSGLPVQADQAKKKKGLR